MPKRSKSRAFDPSRIFQSAEAFFRAVYALQDAAQAGNRNIVPMVLAVNSAFAFELYLKCLITLERDSFEGGHDLQKLYDQLSPETRRELESAHRQIEISSTALEGARARGVKTDVISLLEVGRNAFTLFRYAFEDTEDSVWGLEGVMLLVRKRILEKHLDLVNPEAQDSSFLPDWARPRA